jgi:hypothetical protein
MGNSSGDDREIRARYKKIVDRKSKGSRRRIMGDKEKFYRDTGR